MRALVPLLISLCLSPLSWAERWVPSPDLRWQLNYSEQPDTAQNVDAYVLDLFSTSAETIAELHAQGRHAICRFSAGSLDAQAPDAADFPALLVGKTFSSHSEERHLDIRQLLTLQNIMRARMTLAAHKGCDAVAPDHVKTYQYDSGFPLRMQHQLSYNRMLAREAHALSLSIALKDNTELIPSLLDDFDFAVNEACVLRGDCGRLRAFVQAGKAVLHVQYALDPEEFCPMTTALGFSSIGKYSADDDWLQSCT